MQSIGTKYPIKSMPVETDVGPGKTHNFHFARAGREGDHDNRVDVVILTNLTCRQQPLSFIVRQESDAPSGFVGFGYLAYRGFVKPTHSLTATVNARLKAAI